MITNASICYLVLFLIDSFYTNIINDFLFSGSWSFTIRFDYIIYVYMFIVAHEFIHFNSNPGAEWQHDS